MKLKDKTNVKGKNFFKKVDPISFALVVLLGASATFAAFQLATTGGVTPVNIGVGGIEDDAAAVGSVSNPQWLDEYVMSPLSTEEVAVTTTFWDEEADATQLAGSLFVVELGQSMFSEQSWGTSFRDYNNAVVDVKSVLSGVVSSIEHDEIIRGTIVTIDHENGAQSVFTGLYQPMVSVGDEVAQGDVLGTTGLSLLEPEAGNVVHMEFTINGEYVNPESIIGQRLGDL